MVAKWVELGTQQTTLNMLLTGGYLAGPGVACGLGLGRTTMPFFLAQKINRNSTKR